MAVDSVSSFSCIATVTVQDCYHTMGILHVLGILFIIIWLVSWLALKVTFAAIHALVFIGVVLLIAGFVFSR
jgi:hypothetical protein